MEIEIQTNDMSEAQLHSETAPVQDVEPLQVLVVEDNVANQIVTTTFISALGAKTTVVENGKLAVEAVQNCHYDMVLMDIQMPVMDGVEATKNIRALGGIFSDLPIIAVTANVLPEQRQECLAAGMNDYVTKPVNQRLLKNALVRWARNDWLNAMGMGAQIVELTNKLTPAERQKTDPEGEESLKDILSGLDYFMADD